MSRSYVRVLASALVVAALGSVSTESRAEPYVVGVLEGWFVPNTTTPGIGATVIGGWGLDLDPLLIGPQLAVGGHFHAVGHTDVGLPPGESHDGVGDFLLRATVGFSVGIAGPVEVSLYGRGGPGMAAAGDLVTSAGVAIDTGLSVDARLSRDVTLGGQAGYAGLFAIGGQTGDLHAISIGPRLGVWF